MRETTTSSGLEILAIQSTPFCNIDCDYCYLPNRDSKKTMSREVFIRVLERTFELPNLGADLTIFWHGGEPFATPIAFYRDAFNLAQKLKPRTCSLSFGFQTNGTLFTDDWCAFIRESGARVGVSIDGPDAIHNEQRSYRSGRGTHARVMHSISLLKEHGIPFRVTSVVTDRSLGSARELYYFIKSTGCQSWGFNIEELQGVNRRRSFELDSSDDAVRRFVRELFCLWLSDSQRMKVREFDSLMSQISKEGSGSTMQVARPFALINVDVDGNFSTFSPELLGCQTHHGRFVFGNVLSDSFSSALQNETYLAVISEISDGIEACEKSCQYFDLCGGGSPASKFFEFGRFDVTETRSCKTRTKILVDEVLGSLEDRLLVGA